jgi:hypothetical protein
VLRKGGWSATPCGAVLNIGATRKSVNIPRKRFTAPDRIALESPSFEPIPKTTNSILDFNKKILVAKRRDIEDFSLEIFAYAKEQIPPAFPNFYTPEDGELNTNSADNISHRALKLSVIVLIHTVSG